MPDEGGCGVGWVVITGVVEESPPASTEAETTDPPLRGGIAVVLTSL